MNDTQLSSSPETQHLSYLEDNGIKQNLKLELIDKEYFILKRASIACIVVAATTVWGLYNHINITILISWFLAMGFVHLANFFLTLYYEFRQPTAADITPWVLTFRLAIFLSAITWGSMGIIFSPSGPAQQIFILFFLAIVPAAMALGTVTDFVSAVIGIGCTLIPLILKQFYLGFIDNTSNYHLQMGSSLIMYMAVLLVASSKGYNVVKKSAELSLINIALSAKLADANMQLKETNNILEKRVKDRTLELQNTLNLVTHQATHDHLTDLPNQRLLEQYLTEAIETAQRTRGVFAVAFFGLNRTKIISDSLGHHTGSLIIKAVAERLKSLEQQSNLTSAHTHYTITHAWGDVFVVVLSPLNTEETVSIVRKLFSALQEPFYLVEKSFSITASIGVCLYPKDGDDIKSLLMNAEAAMFRAKKYGGNKFEFYTSDLNAHTSKQLELESGLYNALAEQQFILHYQPIVNAKTGAIVGMEALTRWQHPTLGLISPIDFIPIAEDIGLIVPLGEWALKEACRQTKKWHDSGFAFLRVAVNLAAKQLAQESIIATITNTLKESGLPADALELEFTETAILDEKIIPLAKKLKGLGIHLAIDDFGTGYSGLTYVKQFSIDKLKIDKSFVQDIGANKESETIILTIIDMAKKLGMLTLAEGVETENQLLFLKEHGCDLIQGYYFSRPVDADTFASLLYKKDFVQSDQSKYLN